MRIQKPNHNINKANRPPQSPPPNQTQGITQRIVDATVDKTLAGTDRVAGALSGLATGATAYLSKMPNLAKDAGNSAINLYQADKIGPNVKVLATLASPLIAGAAVAGAGLGLVVASGAGLITGFTTHNPDKPRDFTVGEAVSKVWSKTRDSVENFGGEMVAGSQRIEDIEVKPGDDLWDIPLPPFARTGKTVAATAAGIAIGAVGGIATVFTTTFREIASGIDNAQNNPSAATVLGAVAGIVGAPVTGLVDGIHKAVSAPIKAAGAAWKEDSLYAGVQAAKKFDREVGSLANGLGGIVGGAAAAVPSAVGTVLSTTASELGRGLKSAVTSEDLNLPARVLTAAGSVIAAPVSGLVHGVSTGVVTPLSSLSQAVSTGSCAEGLAKGIADGHQGTKGVAGGAGGAVAGVAIGGVSALGSTVSAAVREVGGGLVDSATNPELNIRGKILDGVSGIPGDVVSAAVHGVGALVGSSAIGAVEGYKGKSASNGVFQAADFGTKSVHAAATPRKAMIENVEQRP